VPASSEHFASGDHVDVYPVTFVAAGLVIADVTQS
jgi:hypothetical protein